MRDAATFAQETDFIGAQLEATAGPDAISVSISGLTKYTNELLELFTDAVLHPAFAPDQFARVKRQTLSALAAEKKQPSALASKLSGKVLYGSIPTATTARPRPCKRSRARISSRFTRRTSCRTTPRSRSSAT